jgi:hypothetical protein
MVSCPATIVGPSTEKGGLQWKTMKKKRMMTTILSFLNTVILSWEKLKEKLKGNLKGKLKERHMMSPLMILVGPLLVHRENVKNKERGKSDHMLEDHKKSLYIPKMPKWSEKAG